VPPAFPSWGLRRCIDRGRPWVTKFSNSGHVRAAICNPKWFGRIYEGRLTAHLARCGAFRLWSPF
jgi:hypothetical protein